MNGKNLNFIFPPSIRLGWSACLIRLGFVEHHRKTKLWAWAWAWAKWSPRCATIKGIA